MGSLRSSMHKVNIAGERRQLDYGRGFRVSRVQSFENSSYLHSETTRFETSKLRKLETLPPFLLLL
jgi:hypothetical protein